MSGFFGVSLNEAMAQAKKNRAAAAAANEQRGVKCPTVENIIEDEKLDKSLLRPVKKGNFGSVYNYNNEFIYKQSITKDITEKEVAENEIYILEKIEKIIRGEIESDLTQQEREEFRTFIPELLLTKKYENCTIIKQQYIHVQDLEEYLKNNNLLEQNIGIVIIQNLIKAVELLHKVNMVHRDLKPANFLVKLNTDNKPTGGILLIDFGLTKELNEGGKYSDDLGGTPDYFPKNLFYNSKFGKTAEEKDKGLVLRRLAGNPSDEDFPLLYPSTKETDNLSLGKTLQEIFFKIKWTNKKIKSDWSEQILALKRQIQGIVEKILTNTHMPKPPPYSNVSNFAPFYTPPVNTKCGPMGCIIAGGTKKKKAKKNKKYLTRRRKL